MNPTSVKESLARLEAESWELYLAELRRLDVEIEEVTAPDWTSLRGQFLRSDAGTPLGRGYRSGSPIAGPEVGRHIDRWMTVLRADVCAYCGVRPALTVDHIVPRSTGREDVNRWVNLTGACAPCNNNKGTKDLLGFLLARSAKARRRRAAKARRRARKRQAAVPTM